MILLTLVGDMVGSDVVVGLPLDGGAVGLQLLAMHEVVVVLA